MVKKILFIGLLLISVVGFSQKTMKNLSAAPNPFISSTTISFVSNVQQKTLITIQNVLGKIVFNKQFLANKGKNSIFFSKKNLHSGIYIYTVRNSKETISKRLVIK